MHPPEILAMVIVIVGAIYLFYIVMKKLVINTILGVILLFLLNYTVFTNDPIPIKLITVAIVAILGIVGVIALSLLHYIHLL